MTGRQILDVEGNYLALSHEARQLVLSGRTKDVKATKVTKLDAADLGDWSALG